MFNSLFAVGMPGTSELLIVLAICIMVFGLGKIPKVMAELGQGMKEFRNSFKDETENE
jgi:sec-independent protein translocase protein TatA